MGATPSAGGAVHAGGALSVTIAVLTFHREVSLRRTLASLAALEPPGRDADVEIVVIDNSPRATSSDVVFAAVASMRWPLRLVHEPRPGIAHARNAAVTAAASADALVFVDDDEEVSPRWLLELLRTAEDFDADAVTGPVLSAFDREPPRWMQEAGYFERTRHVTGALVARAANGNLLLTRRALDSLGQDPYDLRFNDTGGEDTLLTRTLTEAGARLVWCDEAVAVEHVGPERCTARWVFTRVLRQANTAARCRMLLATTAGQRARIRVHSLLAGGAKGVAGTAALVASPVMRSWPWYRAVRLASVGAGLLLAGLDVAVREYRRPRGAR